MFGNKKQEELTVQELERSQNTIAKGTVIKGDIESYGNVRIEGEVVGNIISKSKVVLGKTSKVHGNILAQNVEIEGGELTGTLEVAELLVLKAAAVVNGDISTSKLVVESGATFNGKCKMGESSKEIKLGEKTPATEPKRKAEATA